MSRVRNLSVRSRWAIVLALTTMSFVVAQRAAATPPAIPSRATARSELDVLVVTSRGLDDLSKLWIDSKHARSLRLQATEKSALQAMLNGCAP